MTCPHGEPLAGCPDTYPDDEPADPLRLLTDAELEAMTCRAYAGAAAAWTQLRRWRPPAGTPPEDARGARALLANDAASLDDWHDRLRDEMRRRHEDPEA